MKLLPNLDAPDNDPRLWLEEIDGEQAVAWVERENTRTWNRLADAGFEADRDALTAIFDRDDNLPLVNRRGDFVYNFWKDASNPRGLWRRTTLASYSTTHPEWDILINLDALAAVEGEDWVWRLVVSAPAQSSSVLVNLSRGGSDAGVLREFDIETRRFVVDGFILPEAKQGASWLDGDTLLVASTLGDGCATTSGYASTVRRWHRGQTFAEATVVFSVPDDHMAAYAWVDRTADAPRVFYSDQKAFFDVIVHVGNAQGPQVLVEIPSDSWWSVKGDDVAIRPRTAWTVGGVTYPPDTLLGGRLSELSCDPTANPTVDILFEPHARRSLGGFFWAGHRLVVMILDNLKPDFVTYRREKDGWLKGDLAGLPGDGMVDVWQLDRHAEEANGDMFASVQDPVTPATLFLLEVGKAPAAIKRAPAVFDSQNLMVKRHEAVSPDGERIPYVQVGPEGACGDAPVLMYGYGGFGATQHPYYNNAVGKLWLEKGGTYVLANLRGGGEFGTAWHQAGMREGKALSHDDFAAVAKDLVERGVTVPRRIAAEGGSNGGILITNMLTRYPDRFGALFCTIPVIDMRRYAKLLAGASWIAEYGDPDAPDDWAFLQHISAYHTVTADRPSPPILIATSRRDDRVHPGHARKMAAKLHEIGREVWFYEATAGGHGYGKDNRERATFTALGYSFLRRALGWGAD